MKRRDLEQRLGIAGYFLKPERAAAHSGFIFFRVRTDYFVSEHNVPH